MIKDLIINITASIIYDFSRSFSKSEMLEKTAVFLGTRSSKNDFPDRYIEALVELRLQKKDKVVLNFFREEDIMKAFYNYYYADEKAGIRGNEQKLHDSLKHCIEALQVGDEVKQAKIVVKDEIGNFWQIFKQKVHESRSVSDVESKIKKLKQADITAYYREKISSYFLSHKSKGGLNLSDIYIPLNFSCQNNKNIDLNLTVDTYLYQVITKKQYANISDRLIIVEGYPLHGKTCLCYKVASKLLQDGEDVFFFELRKFDTPKKVNKFIENPFVFLKQKLIEEIDILHEKTSHMLLLEKEKKVNFHGAIIILDGLSEMDCSEINNFENLFRNLHNNLEEYSQSLVILTSRFFSFKESENLLKTATILKLEPLNASQRYMLLQKIECIGGKTIPKTNINDALFDLSNIPYFLTNFEDYYLGEYNLFRTEEFFYELLETILNKNPIYRNPEDVFKCLGKMAYDRKKGFHISEFTNNKEILSSFYFKKGDDNLLHFFSSSLEEYFLASFIYYDLVECLPYIPEIEKENKQEHQEKSLQVLEKISKYFVQQPISKNTLRYIQDFIEKETDRDKLESVARKIKRAFPELIKHQLLFNYQATILSRLPINDCLSGFRSFWTILKQLKPNTNLIPEESVKDFIDIIKVTIQHASVLVN